MKRILILGAGCAGLSLARALRFAPVEITLLDRRSGHLDPSKLYVAVFAGPRGLETPLSEVLTGQKNVQVVQGEAVYLNSRQRRLILADRTLPYDVLVIATGSQPRYEREIWQQIAPALKCGDDARRVREKLLDRGTASVIIGGGVAGVELASAVALTNRSRRVVIIESGKRILAGFPQPLAEEAERRLRKLGVELRCGLHVVGMDAESVRASGAQGRERFLSRAVLWAGGVEGSGFGAALHSEAGAALDEAGRVRVEPDLTLPGHKEIFVIGDLARVLHDGVPLDGLATVAAQQGRYVASSIRERLAGYDARPFEYVDQGRFAILGRGGVGMIGDAQLRGPTAWLAAKLAQKWSRPTDLLRRLRAYSAATGSRT